MQQVRKDGKPTRKETLFCEYYHRLRDAGEAAARAGFSPEQGRRLLRKPELRQLLEEWEREEHDPQRIRADVIAGLRRLAFGPAAGKIRWTEDEDGEELDLFPVSEIKRRQNETLELRFFDRFRALEMLLELAESEQNGSGAAQLYQALERSIFPEERDADAD